MTTANDKVHDCPHCECAQCAFCGKELDDPKHSVEWDYTNFPGAYTKSKPSHREYSETVCNSCGELIDFLLSQLTHKKEGLTTPVLEQIVSNQRYKTDG